MDEGDRLYALALRVTRDADLASDAVQEAFTSALERRSEFRGAAKVSTWLHRIVYNKAIDLLRRRWREAVPIDDELGPDASVAPPWSRPDEILSNVEAERALEAALATLTPVQRAAFELREVEGLPTQEVAEILELPAATVRVYLHRARLRLRERLAGAWRPR